MAGRSSPPLFDLLRNGDGDKPRRTVILTPKPAETSAPPATATRARAAPAVPASSTPTLETKPTAPPAAQSQPPAPADRTQPSPAPHAGSRTMAIPTTFVYAAGAIVLVAVIVAWSAGVRFGERRAEAQYYNSLEQASIADPTLSPSTAAPPPPVSTGTSSSGSSSAGTSQSAGAPPPAPVARGVRVLLAGGPATGDPRQPGNNYLHLASAVSPDQAQQAVNYLASRGFTAAAIPTVDRRGRPSNDSGSYDLFSLLPIPSAEYSARRSERESHQRLARNLGRDWLARPEGNINFDSTQWRKFDG